MAESNIEINIEQTLLDNTLILERLRVYLLRYEREMKSHKVPVSTMAALEYKIPLDSFVNTVCGYLEELKELKNK